MGEHLVEQHGAGDLVALGGDDVLEVGERAAVDPREGGPAPRADEHRLGPHRRQLALGLPGRAARVERHGHAPSVEDGEVRGGEVPVGAGDDADRVALGQTQATEAAGVGRDLAAQRPVVRLLAAADERDGVVGVRVEDGGEVGHSGRGLGRSANVQPPAVQGGGSDRRY